MMRLSAMFFVLSILFLARPGVAKSPSWVTDEVMDPTVVLDPDVAKPLSCFRCYMDLADWFAFPADCANPVYPPLFVLCYRACAGEGNQGAMDQLLAIMNDCGKVQQGAPKSPTAVEE